MSIKYRIYALLKATIEMGLNKFDASNSLIAGMIKKGGHR